MALADPVILIPAIAENVEGIEFVWSRRRELDNWRSHVTGARSAFADEPTAPHHAAEHAFRLAFSLVKYVAVPWGIDLSPQDIFALCGMIADPKVPA